MDARHGSFPEDKIKDRGRLLSDSPTTRALRDIAFGSVSPCSSLNEGSKIKVKATLQFAGMVSEVFEYPFDLAKVRLQSQVLNNTARFGGPLDCLMQTWKTEGVRGLYRVSCVWLDHQNSLFLKLKNVQGLPVPMFGSMAETAGLFVAYSQLQNLVRWSSARPASEDFSIAELGLAAGGAGFLTSFILSVLSYIAQLCVFF